MKKISSLLLVLCMLLLLAACTTTDTTDISKYQAAIDATEPTTVRVTTTFTSSVFSGVILNGEYDITIADDGSATVEYTYEELNALCPLSEELFIAARGEYLKVSIGKGYFTEEELFALINSYNKLFE